MQHELGVQNPIAVNNVEVLCGPIYCLGHRHLMIESQQDFWRFGSV